MKLHLLSIKITRYLLLCLFVGMQSNCVHAQTYTMTNGSLNACTGTFLDPGGSGNYLNSSYYVYTICPVSCSGLCLRVTFTQFNLESGFDFLKIYDGPNTSAPMIASLSGNGVPSPSFFSASAGCLTFEFISDNINTFSGWSATISTVACNPQVTCSFSHQSPSCSGTPMTFAWTGASPDVSNTLFSWNFGPTAFPVTALSGTGSFYTSTNEWYSSSGSKTVTLNVVYATSSCTSTQTFNVLQPAAVNVSCSRSPSGNVSTGANIYFTGSATTTCGSITNWDWDFGDASPHALTQNAYHSYATVGLKTVILTATNSANTNSTCTLTVNVNVTAMDWTSKATPTGNFVETGDYVATDNAGNSYITGGFGAYLQTNTVNFGASSVSVPDNRNAFYLAKYNSTGMNIWASTFLGTSNNVSLSGRAIDLDQQGNIYVCGDFWAGFSSFTYGSVTFTGYGGFLAKYNPSGTVQWVRKISNTSTISGVLSRINIDPSGRIYVSGFISNTVTVDNGSSTTTVNSSGFGTDILVLKYDLNGVLQWSYVLGGGQTHNFNTSEIAAIKADHSGNAYVTATFSGNVESQISNGGWDVLLAKISNGGQFLWADHVGGTSDDDASGIELGRSGEIYLSGTYLGSVVIGSTTLTTSSAIATSFAARYEHENSTRWVWGKSIGSTASGEFATANDMDIDCSNNIYVCGTFYGNFPINASNYTSNGMNDFFIAKLDGSSGTLLSAMVDGGIDEDGANGVAVGDDGIVHVTGFYHETVNFQPVGSSTATHGDHGFEFTVGLAGNGPDIFVATYDAFNGACCPVNDYVCGDIYPAYSAEAIYIYAGDFCTTPTYTTIHGGTGQVEFNAATEVLLSTGFSAENGSDFRAWIDPCSSGSQRLAGATEELAPDDDHGHGSSSIVSVIPNPSSQSFIIALPDSKVDIYDARLLGITGELISEFTNLSTTNPYEFGSELAPGIYFLEVIAGNETNTIKIIKTQ
jgi:hypothetical protein